MHLVDSPFFPSRAGFKYWRQKWSQQFNASFPFFSQFQTFLSLSRLQRFKDRSRIQIRLFLSSVYALGSRGRISPRCPPFMPILRVQNIFSILAISLKHPPPLCFCYIPFCSPPRRLSRFNQPPLPCQNGKGGTGIQHARFPHYLNNIFLFRPLGQDLLKCRALPADWLLSNPSHHCCRRFSLPFALRETCLSAAHPPSSHVCLQGGAPRGRVLFPSARPNFPHVFGE